MNLKVYVLSCIAAICWSGCSEEELIVNESTQEKETFSLTVTQEKKDNSRLAFGDDFLTTYWENGDILTIRNIEDSSKLYELTTSLDQPSTTATFTYSGALRGGTYLVYYSKYYHAQKPVFFDQETYHVGLKNEKDLGFDIGLYGIMTIKTGQTSASVELKPAYSMLHFNINDPNKKLAKSFRIQNIGMMAPKTGFKTKVTLQNDGTLTETGDRIPQLEIWTSSLGTDSNGKEYQIGDLRTVILPIDLSNEDVIFYIAYGSYLGANNATEEIVYEIKKKGIDLKPGVCYHITLDIEDAKVYDLTDHELDCADDFRALSYKVNSNWPYTVTKDIDFTGVEYFPISNNSITIDGNDKTLENITIDWPYEGAGLTNYSSNVIKNLTIKNAKIKGTNYVGGFCGNAGDAQSTFTGCKLINSTIEGTNYVGGILGGGSVTSIKTCTVENSQIIAKDYVGSIAGNVRSVSDSKVKGGSVKGQNTIGGIAGYAVNAIKSCSSSATVEATGDYVGGIVGSLQSVEVMYTSQGSASQCANEGKVTGNNYVGGITGNVTRNNSISECYSIGQIEGANYVGGIVGYQEGTEHYDKKLVSNCYNLGKVTGSGNSIGGIVGESVSPNTISNCYSTGDISTDCGIIGTVYEYSEKKNTLSTCITRSSKLGDNENAEYVNLTDINSKLKVIDGDELYFPDRVWDTSLYPYNCTILLWQGTGFGMDVSTGN